MVLQTRSTGLRTEVEAEVRDWICTSLNYYTPSIANIVQVDTSKWPMEGSLASRQTVSCHYRLTEMPNHWPTAYWQDPDTLNVSS